MSGPAPPPPPPPMGPMMQTIAVHAEVDGNYLLHFEAKHQQRTAASGPRPTGVALEIPPQSLKAVTFDLKFESDVVRSTLRSAGLQIQLLADGEQLQSDACLIWSRKVPEVVFSLLQDGQLVNHIPGRHQIGHKDSLGLLMTQAQKVFPDIYNFVPTTYVLPQQLSAWKQTASKHIDKIWISKPPASSQGRGIEVFRATNERMASICRLAQECGTTASTKPQGGSSASHDPESSEAGMVIQEYICNPYLIEGLKFDLRVYVLVVSVQPLCFYVYNDGIVKFCSSKFSLDHSTLDDSFRHLANYALNKHNDDFDESVEEGKGHRWTQKALMAFLDKTHGPDTSSKVRGAIDDIVTKLLISTTHWMRTESQRLRRGGGRCFELLGLDIELDASLRPWLLEVNVCPSLEASKSDTMSQSLLNNLVVDTLNLVGIPVKSKRSASATRGVAAACTGDDSRVSILLEALKRRGDFRLGYPKDSTVTSYEPLYNIGTSSDKDVNEQQALARRLANALAE